MHSLRTRLAILTVLIAALAVGAVTALSVVFIRSNERRQSDQLLLLLCETGERNLNYYFNSVEKSVRRVAAYTEKELNGLEEEQLREQVEKVRAYFDVIAHKTNGVLTYYYRIDPTLSPEVKGFWYTNLDGNTFTEHEVTDITQYDMEDTTKLVWFTQPRKTGNPVWLPPYVTENLWARVISYNIPIYWRARFVGVIGIEIDYTMLAEQVESIRLYENGYAFLTDAEGSLILHPRIDVARLGETANEGKPEGILGENTFLRYTFQGTEKEAAWLRLQNGMRLYVCVPEEETEGDWRRLVQNVLLISAAVLAATVALTLLFTRRITRPLQELTEAAKQADQGNYDFTLTYRGKDEVGILTGTFSRMAAHMKEYITDLNRRVFVDALTSVRNKGAYTSYMEELQKQVDQDPEGTKLAVCVFDCDDLKIVNDRYGHEKGDLYLKNASRTICRVFQHSPVFRIGGDEFTAILRKEDYRDREELVRVFEQICEETHHASENSWEQVRVAMGMAEYNPAVDRSVADTVRRADKMMYTNKKMHKAAVQ